MDKKRIKIWRKELISNELQLIALALITGVFSGAMVTVYNIFTFYGEKSSVAWYEALLMRPAFIPLLFVALFTGAILIGTLVKFIPLVRGSGIPQIEGAIRGVLVFKWFRVLVAGFAASLAAIFLGMNAGSEGPSMLIGGCAGGTIGSLLKRDRRKTRYLITGGASAGLAVAFNAPLTGFLFAFEEAHKKFTPEIFITAFFSVISGVFTRNGLRLLVGMIDPNIKVSSTFAKFDLSVIQSFSDIALLSGIVAIAAIVTGLLGVGFYYSVIGLRQIFSKLTFFRGTGKFLIPFGLAGVFGLIAILEMGGGHNLIEALGTNGGAQPFSVTLNFTSTAVVAIIAILIMKFISSVCNMGCGVPCGVFIPMLAIGACAGGVVSLVAQTCGMSVAYSDVIVMICMATFFATIVKAPLTSLVMIFELTGSYNFNLLLPAMLGVAIGYTIGKLFRTEAIYDVFLGSFIKTHGVAKSGKREKFILHVMEDCPAKGKEIHDILLPWSTVITGLKRGHHDIVPSSEVVIFEGDIITAEAETDDREEAFGELTALMGEQRDDAFTAEAETDDREQRSLK